MSTLVTPSSSCPPWQVDAKEEGDHKEEGGRKEQGDRKGRPYYTTWRDNIALLGAY